MINFFLPTRLIIGEGALDKLSEQKLCGDKAIIVTYGDYVKQLGYLDRTIEQLKKAGVEISQESVVTGLKKARVGGRLEEVCKNPSCKWPFKVNW